MGFHLTSPAPCPYLSGQQERKVFSLLEGPDAPLQNAILTHQGYRRSQNIIYRPDCDSCNACKPVRIRLSDFEESGPWRRNLKTNSDLIRKITAPKATSEQFSVLRAYLDARHAEGGMAEMTVLDYTCMVEQTPVDTIIVEYRQRENDGEEKLIAAALTDRLPDGLSMVYSFFDPDFQSRGLGNFMILDHINLAQSLGLDHIYLGYWIAASEKMAYKARFKPLEHWTGENWENLEL